jgi:hypothetical protein
VCLLQHLSASAPATGRNATEGQDRKKKRAGGRKEKENRMDEAPSTLRNATEGRAGCMQGGAGGVSRSGGGGRWSFHSLVEEALRHWREEDGGERMRREEEGRGSGERETAGEWLRMARNFTNESGEGEGVTRWERMEMMKARIASGLLNHHDALTGTCTKRVAEQLLSDSDAALHASGATLLPHQSRTSAVLAPY